MVKLTCSKFLLLSYSPSKENLYRNKFDREEKKEKMTWCFQLDSNIPDHKGEKNRSGKEDRKDFLTLKIM